MRLAIDVTRSLDRALQGRLPTGVDRVAQMYMQHFQGQALALLRVAGRWLVFNAKDSGWLFQQLLGLPLRKKINIYALVAKYYAFSWGRPSSHKVLINVTHSGLQNKNYQKKVQSLQWRGFYFLHDLIPLDYPEYSRPGVQEEHKQRLKAMLQPENAILVNSRDTEQGLMAYAIQRQLALPPVRVAHLAAAKLPAGADTPLLPGPYFVVLGTIEARKNHLMLLQVWRQMQHSQPHTCPRLVIIGQRGWECEQVLDMLERCAALKPVVLEIARCSDEELATWLRHARALLFPSFAEGYGMPLVEALGVGLPVIASDLPVFREIAGDAAHYLHPLDALGWLQAVQDFAVQDSPLRTQYCQRAQAWHPPTWQAHFEEADRLLRDMQAPVAATAATARP